MIEESINNSNPVFLSGYFDRLTASTASVPKSVVTPTINLSIPEVCCDCFDVFGGGSGVQNDKTSLLFKRAISSDTITLKLKKNGEEVATLNSNTLGSFYDFGTWTTHAGQEHYIGYVVDWDLVLSAHGFGTYVIDAERVILGNSDTISSDSYFLRQYDDLLANESVVFEWTHNGRIRSNEFNYADMDWTQYIRVKGKFGTWEPSLEKDEVIYSNYRIKQVQDEIINKYTFESKLIKYNISKVLILDMMLAGEIFATDFNLYNHRKDIIQLPIRQDEIPSIEELQGNEKAVLTLQFVDRFKDTLKQGA